ncbi:MAG: arabinose efflux permease family protein, partial [Hyphomicrobiales bacterium]|nr:arabinose efflux permease family protein [Hyphomicrobiales bacterium]
MTSPVRAEPNALEPHAPEPHGYRAPTHREALWIVAGVLVPVFMASLDQTIVASALPTIGRELGATSSLSWIVTAYLLTMTAATPLYGKLSDIHGRRAILRVAIVIFMAGGVASALAPSVPLLILARALQGIGGAGLISQSMTVLGDIAPPKQRARYYTYFSIIYTTAGGLGPALGGYIAQHLHWSYVFWLSVPLGVASWICVTVLLRNLPRHEKPHRLDLLGAALIVGASSTFMFVISAGGKTYGWTSPEILQVAGASGVLWGLLVWRLLRAPEPLIPLHILRNPIVIAAIVANSFGWGAVIAMNIYLPLYLQAIHGMAPGESGLYLMVLMVTVNASALGGAQVAARMERYKLYPIVTNVFCILAMAYLAWRADTITPLQFEVVLALVGLGFGPLAPVTTVAVQNTVNLSQLGVAISTMAFGRSLFAAVLVAALGAVVLHALGGLEARGAA